MARTQTARTPSSRRGRRVAAAPDPIRELAAAVDALIRENRELKRHLARLEVGSERAQQPPGLRTLQRRVAQALDGAEARRPAPPQARRRITDPVVLEKRRAALAKARQARADKRAAAQAAAAQ